LVDHGQRGGLLCSFRSRCGSLLLCLPLHRLIGKQAGELRQGDRLLRGVNNSFQLGSQAHAAISTYRMVPDATEPCARCRMRKSSPKTKSARFRSSSTRRTALMVSGSFCPNYEVQLGMIVLGVNNGDLRLALVLRLLGR